MVPSGHLPRNDGTNLPFDLAMKKANDMHKRERLGLARPQLDDDDDAFGEPTLLESTEPDRGQRMQPLPCCTRHAV